MKAKKGASYQNRKHPLFRNPLLVRETGLTEVVCTHGVGHPTPESVESMNASTKSSHWGVHGCDGCCLRDKPSRRDK